MKCFNHPQVDALGICKSCNKGICKECLTEVKNGIACTATCIEEVNLLNSLINRNKQSYNRTSGVYYRNAFLLGAMSLVFIIYGVFDQGLKYYLLPMGFIFVIGSVLSVISANKYKKD